MTADQLGKRNSIFPRRIAEFYRKNRVASLRYVSELEARKDWLASHRFLPEADLCIDGRVSDFRDAIGILLGILEMYRSPGSKANLGDRAYHERCLKAVRKARSMHVRGQDRLMAKLRLVTAHYSHSRPTSASCAAWEHQIGCALSAGEKHAADLNKSWPGRMVAFSALIDTDLDAIVLLGPAGRVDVHELLRDLRLPFESDRGQLIALLLKAFPPDWKPLTVLPEEHRRAFHSELADIVDANIRFAGRVLETKRPVELLDHKEDLVFVGGHADWISPEDHNAVFILDDAVNEADLLKGFEIALKHAFKNTIIRAISAQDRDWIVPVVVNVPHDDEIDLGSTQCYVERLVGKLAARLEVVSDNLLSYLRVSFDKPDVGLPDWMQGQIKELKHRVFFAPSVSFRKDRLIRPIV